MALNIIFYSESCTCNEYGFWALIKTNSVCNNNNSSKSVEEKCNDKHYIMDAL